MSSFAADKKDIDYDQGARQAQHKIRVCISGTQHNFSAVERYTNDLLTQSKDKGIYCKGPVRMKTKVLRITTRKTPCGEGSKTWDRYSMKVHKRHVDLYTSTELAQQIIPTKLPEGVDVTVVINDRA